MAITVKHKFVSAIPDAGDTTIVQPSNWNDDHDLVGTVPVANGGTGATTLTGYVIGNGSAAMTASTTIPNTAITGLGTASTKDAGVANGVATLDGSGTVPISQLPAAVLGALSYQGTWDASTNTPTLTSSVGTKGYYYVVNVAGSTNLNGITDWKIGDWAVYNGTAWQKVDNTDAVTSVNGYTGTVVLNATDVGAVSSVSGTAPVSVATGTTTPVISLAASYGDTQNPYASKTANYVLASPNGSAGVPTFRALVSADIPSLSSTYIPYTNAGSAIDLNAQTVTNIAHLGLNSTAVPDILLRAYGDNNSTSRISIRGYSSNSSSSSMRVAKFRGTFASPQAPLSGDSLGKFELAGYGTTSSSGYPQASYEGVATENWNATARGSKALFYTTPNTTTTQTLALTLNQDQTATFAGSVTANGVLLTGNTGTVTSVAQSFTGGLISVAGSPITSSGTLALTVAGTSGGIPYFSSGTAWASSAALTQYGVVYGGGAGAAPVATAAGTTGQVLTATTSGAPTWVTPTNTGTVTSVALSLPSIFSVSGSPVTTSGTLTGALANQNANIVFAGPSTGAAAAPTFRLLVATDIPSLAYAPTAGSTSITTLGTIATGTWNGSLITGTYGGTGVNNGSNTITIAGNTSFSGAFTQNFTATANTAVTLPAGNTASANNLLSSATAVGIVTGTPSASNYLRGDGTWASVTASSATNLAGGALGSVPYQLLSGSTTFLAGNTTTTPQFLTSTGVAGLATAPTYTGSTGSGNVVLATSPTLVTPALGTPSAIVLTNATSVPVNQATGTLALANGGTGVTTAPAANAALFGFTTTATSATPLVLTNTSSVYQLFTGSTAQTVTLPVTSTLTAGWTFHIVNNSSQNITVNSSGANLVSTVIPNTTAMVTCILITGTTAASWESGFTDFGAITGTGSVVMSTSPTLVSPVLGTPSSGTLTSCTGLLATGGGTGQSTYAVGDLLQGAASNTLAKLAAVATGNALISGGVTTASSWGKIGLTTHVSGTLAVGNGGTGITTTPTNGQIPIGNGTNYVAAALTAGTGISITNASGAITVTNSLPFNNSASQLSRAWAYYNGVTPSLVSNYNISSVTKNSTGNYTFNFTSAMANANLSVVYGISNDLANSTGSLFVKPIALATGSVNMLVLTPAGSAYDPVYLAISVFN